MVVAKPFYWDKTAHGLFVEAADAPVIPLAPGMVSIPVLGQIGGRSLAEVAADLQSSAGQATAGQPNLVQIDAPAVEPDAMRYPQDRAASG